MLGSAARSLRPSNTRLHLQGAPQRPVAKRPHLRALSGASRCYPGPRISAMRSSWSQIVSMMSKAAAARVVPTTSSRRSPRWTSAFLETWRSVASMTMNPGPFFGAPERNGHCVPVFGGCALSPLPKDQIDMGTMPIYLPLGPFDEVHGFGRVSAIHEAAYLAAVVAATRAGAEVLDRSWLYCEGCDCLSHPSLNPDSQLRPG